MTARALSLAASLLVVGCGDDYLRIVVEGSNRDITATPVGISVSVYGGGESTRYDYTDTLKARDGASVPFSDSVVVFDEGAPSPVSVRAHVSTPRVWGADARLALPGDSRTVHLRLSPGERDIANAARFDGGDGTTAASFRGGLAFAWASLDGVKIAELREPDATVSAVTRERVLSNDPGVSRVRIAARPSTSSFGSDNYAVAWRDGALDTHLVVISPGHTSQTVSLGTSDDVHVALARPGLPFDIVTAVRKGVEVEARAFTISADGEPEPYASPSRLFEGRPIDELVGLVTTADAFVAGARNGDISMLAKSLPAGLNYVETMFDGQARAIGRSADGNLVFVANDLAGGLTVMSFLSGDLATSESAHIAKLPFVAEHPKARVSISECAVAWPEIRDDGTGRVDVRVRLLDGDGRPRASPVYANVDETGEHHSPTTVCVSTTRAYVAFFEESPENPVTGILRVRRVPSDLSLTPSNSE